MQYGFEMIESLDSQGDSKNTTWYREGPKPLMIHINMALSRCAMGEVNQLQVQNLLEGIKKYQEFDRLSLYEIQRIQ